MPELPEQNCSCGAKRSVYSYGAVSDRRLVVIFVKDVKAPREASLCCPFCGESRVRENMPKKKKAKKKIDAV